MSSTVRKSSISVFVSGLAWLALGGSQTGCSAAASDDADGRDEFTTDAGVDGRVAPMIDAGRAVASRGDASATRDAAPASDAGAPDAAGGTSLPWTAAAPRAHCSEGDLPDGKLSGLNGDYRCNLTVAGQVEAPHFLSLAWYGDCAYVNGPDGTTVIRVSPDGTPTVTTTLTTVGFRSNWESMKASAVSGLLVGYESNGANLTVYDVAGDCGTPALKSTLQLGGLGSAGHAGSFSPDGTIYYASSFFTGDVYAVDLAAPEKPVVISSDFERGSHDLFVGKGGTRGYFAFTDLVSYLYGGIFSIIDLTDIQARKPGAVGKLIKEFSWPDGAATQYPIAIQYRGHEYLMITDELGSGSCDNPERPQWSYAHIFDIEDELEPKLVSRIKTEAQDPANCRAASEANGGVSGFGLGTHYCNVDRLQDPRVLACGNWDAGLRVYDIRDPYHPRELAYFDTATANMPSLARILRDQLWIAVTPGTFYVLRIEEGTELHAILGEQ